MESLLTRSPQSPIAQQKPSYSALNQVFRWMCFLFWVILIFLLSHQTRAESGEISNLFRDLLLEFKPNNPIIRKILQFFKPSTGEFNPHADKLFTVRKFAHVTEYFVLYILSFRLFRMYSPLGQTFGWASLFCVFYALADETHQIFIPGREGMITDVFIDSVGMIGAFLLIWFSRPILKYFNKLIKVTPRTNPHHIKKPA